MARKRTALDGLGDVLSSVEDEKGLRSAQAPEEAHDGRDAEQDARPKTKQHPNAGKLHEDQQRYTIIARKDVITSMKRYSAMAEKPIKEIFEEAMTEYLDEHFAAMREEFVEKTAEKNW